MTYAFVLIKDTRKITNPSPNGGEGDFRDIGDQITFSCFTLKLINSDFVIFEKWAVQTEICYVDSYVENIDFHITDINQDKNVEIWYVMESNCSSGVEPSKLNICLFKNGTIHKMESVTNFPGFFSDVDIREWIKDGSEYVINKFDSNFEVLSEEYKTYAINLRNKNLCGQGIYWR
jgi:hypothetical protein